MAKYRITSPGGVKFEITAPDTATQDEVLAYAQQNMGQSTPAEKPSMELTPEEQAVKKYGATGYGVRGAAEAIKETIYNIPSSAGRMGKEIIGAIVHPVQTAEALGGLVNEMPEAITGGFLHTTEKGDAPRWTAFGDLLRERYGSIENLNKTIINDPVGFAMDASVILGGTGVAVEGLGAAKTGAALSTAGKAINPITLAGKVAIPVAKGIGREGKWVWNKTLGKFTHRLPSLSKSGIEKQAADVLAKHTSKGDIYTKNIEASQALEQKIPALKLTRGQISNDPQAILLERSLSRQDSKALSYTVEQRAYANQALQDYYRKKLLSPTEDVGHLVNTLKGQETAIENNLARAVKSLEDEASILSKAPDTQATGKIIRDALVKAKRSMKQRVSASYDAIPNIPVKTSKLDTVMRDLHAEFVKSGDSIKDFPTGITRQISKSITPTPPKIEGSKLLDMYGKPVPSQIPLSPTVKDIGFQELRGYRTQIREALQDATRGANPNYKLARRLGKMQEAVEETINQMENVSGEIAGQYREASKAYGIYDKAFRKGTVSDVLRPGMEAEGFAMQNVEVARQFFKTGGLDSADDFIRAMGSNAEAKQAIRDYASQDLINNALNPQTGELVSKNVHRWYAKNHGILRKFGMENEFRDMVNLQRTVDKAIKTNDMFNKSVAGRILNADPDKIIPQMFSGAMGKNKAAVAEELLTLVKNDPAAIKGLQKSFAKHLMERSQTTGVDLLEAPVVSFSKLSNMVKEYSPAIKVLYKNDPEKIKALIEVQKGYEYLGRTLKSPLGGGSDTAENLLNMITAGTTPMVTSRFAVVNAIKLFAKKFTEYNKEQVNAILTRAVFDPDYAETLIAMSKGTPAKIIKTRINNHLATMGLYLLDKALPPDVAAYKEDVERQDPFGIRSANP